MLTYARTTTSIRVDPAGSDVATAAEIGRAASTLLSLFKNESSQAWLRANMSLGSGDKVIPTVTRVGIDAVESVSDSNQERTLPATTSHLPHTDNHTNTSNTQTPPTKPRRPRKQAPYNFAPIIDKVLKNDPEYAQYSVRRVIDTSGEEKRRQREAKIAERDAAQAEQPDEVDVISSGKKILGRTSG